MLNCAVMYRRWDKKPIDNNLDYDAIKKATSAATDQLKNLTKGLDHNYDISEAIRSMSNMPEVSIDITNTLKGIGERIGYH